ncbi:MAG: hypothetical protein VST71_07240 [Nitrospirota bacterium]|nr:hypothetical protein [Nitrospirota bacterium]
MRKGKTLGIRLLVTMACMFLIYACGGGGGGTTTTTGSGGGTTTETATISGSVSGTIIIAVNDSGEIVASDDSTGKTPDANGNYPFTLTGIPVGQNIRVYLITSGGIYPMYFDSNGDTNVFSLASSTTIDLGFVDTDTTGQEGKAIPQNNPTDYQGVTGGAENPDIPDTITNPEPPAGSSLNQLITDGLEAVSNEWMLKARNYFKAAVDLAGDSTSNDADTARFFYALTRVAAISADTFSDGTPGDMNSLGDILDRCGALPSDTARANWDTIECLDPLPSNTTDGAALQTFLYKEILPEIEGAITNLGAVSQDFNKQWIEPFDKTMVESDRGDVLFFKAALEGLAANLYTQYAYNLYVDIAAEGNKENTTTEDFLNNYGSFLSLTGSYIDNLNSAQTLYSAALNDLNAAIDEIKAETDNQDDDLIDLGDMTPSEITETQTDITNYNASLNGETPVTIDDRDTPSDTTDDTIIDLSQFFADPWINLRTILPPFAGDDPTGLLPDPSFGGVLIQLNGYAPDVLNTDTDNNGTADIFENPTQLTTDSIAEGNPDWSPDGTKIVFHSGDKGSRNIYVMDSDGTNPIQLTSASGDNAKPHWTPDGRIIFQSDRSENYDIYIMSADGTGLIQITSDADNDNRPDVCPGDGTKIVFDSNRSGNREIWVINTDGTGLTQLTTDTASDTRADWMPDCSRIVFESERTGNREIWVMDADGSNPTQLTNTWWTSNGHPHFSPDGSRIAFWSLRTWNREVWIMNSDGTGQNQITDNPDDDGGAAWSPDSTRLVFRSSRAGNDDIWVYTLLLTP